jgi:uncharacterized protein with NRDE domain
MCLIVFRLHDHPRYRLILGANRDEFYNRPTLPLSLHSAESVLSGLDLLAGGTWLGAGAGGRVSAITNIRRPEFFKKFPGSRGALALDFLRSSLSAFEYMEQVRRSAVQYGGFNLLVFSEEEALCYHSVDGRLEKIESGVHGLSNDALNTPWPKVERVKAQFASATNADFEPEDIMNLFRDQSVAPDLDLPDTGVGLELERMLSPVFIQSAQYGTRSTSLLLIDNEGHIQFFERGHVPQSNVRLELKAKAGAGS